METIVNLEPKATRALTVKELKMLTPEQKYKISL